MPDDRRRFLIDEDGVHELTPPPPDLEWWWPEAEPTEDVDGQPLGVRQYPAARFLGSSWSSPSAEEEDDDDG